MYSDVSKRNTPAIPEIGSYTVNKVLRDTYRLLSATLLFSAVVAGTSIALRLPAPGLLVTLAGYFGLLFPTYKLRIIYLKER